METPPRTVIYLIRHGQTDWNLARRLQGYTDVPLNETGRLQARALAERLAGTPFAHCYASDLSRAQETARNVAEMQGLPVLTDPRLREIWQGDLEGLNRSELRHQYRDFLEVWLSAPTSTRIPGGETLEECQQRIVAAVTEIAERHCGERVAVFAHNLTIKAFLCWVLRLSMDQFRQFRQDETALNIVALEGSKWEVVRVNDTNHFSQGHE